MMAKDEIACLDEMSLEEDIPEDLSDSEEGVEKASFTGN
jgi:hypothetical protein